MAGAARPCSVRAVPAGQGCLRRHCVPAFDHPGQSAPPLDLAGYRAAPPLWPRPQVSEPGWGIFAAAVAASVILPALIHTLFWRGFSRRGMLWTRYGSLACCLVLQFFGPTVSGLPH